VNKVNNKVIIIPERNTSGHCSDRRINMVPQRWPLYLLTS